MHEIQWYQSNCNFRNMSPISLLEVSQIKCFHGFISVLITFCAVTRDNTKPSFFLFFLHRASGFSMSFSQCVIILKKVYSMQLGHS